MIDFFTITSIVIAVSGSTYTAIYAIRGHLSSRIEDRLRKAETYLEVLKESVLEPTKEQADIKGRKIQCWCRAWRWSHAAPIIAFMVTSVVLSMFVLYECWDGKTSASSPSYWHTWKWGLIALLVIDYVSISMTVISYRLMGSNLDDLELSHNTEIASRAEARNES